MSQPPKGIVGRLWSVQAGWDPVNAVATTTLPDGRTIAITGGDDGTVRRWDLTTGQPIGTLLTGHTGWVRTVATTTLPDGRTIAITGGQDRTIRRWDLTIGNAIGTPLTGHTDWIQAVATTTLNGQPIAITGSDDSAARIWDLTTGKAIGTPLTGHTDWVRAVATTTLNGQPIAITGSDDGTARIWDLTTGKAIVVVRAHLSPVTGVAVTDQPAGTGPVVLTVGLGGSLTAWDVPVLLEARAIGVDEVFAGENTGAPDRLSRVGLASHVAERLRLLTTGERSPSPAAGDPSGSGIVHLDGRWGAGKTTLVELMLRERVADLGRPVVVRYDAWRQAAIAPEWWSLAAEIRRAVHGSRATPAELVLALAGFARRLGRSTSTWVALLVATAAVIAGRWLHTGPGGLPQQATTVLGLVTSLTGVLAFAFVITRSLFWSAPVLGRLHVRTDDNPLGEISSIVGHLRRWSPREGVPQRLIDWALAGWLAATGSAALWWKPTVTAWRGLPPAARGHLIRAGVILVVLTIAAAALRFRAQTRRLEIVAHANTPRAGVCLWGGPWPGYGAAGSAPSSWPEHASSRSGWVRRFGWRAGAGSAASSIRRRARGCWPASREWPPTSRSWQPPCVDGAAWCSS